jgi:hypothetical protein
MSHAIGEAQQRRDDVGGCELAIGPPEGGASASCPALVMSRRESYSAPVRDRGSEGVRPCSPNDAPNS